MNAMDNRKIPDKPHTRAFRVDHFLVRRLTANDVRVVAGTMYIDLLLGPGSTMRHVYALIAMQGLTAWARLPRRGGRSGTTRSHAEHRAEGLRYVQVYLNTMASAALDAGAAECGSARAAVETALLKAFATDDGLGRLGRPNE